MNTFHAVLACVVVSVKMLSVAAQSPTGAPTIAPTFAANATWCQRSGRWNPEVDANWKYDSNHCVSEYPLWGFSQFVLCVAYCLGFLSTEFSMRRYKYMGVFRFTIVIYAVLMIIWSSELVANAKDQLAYACITLIVNFAHWILILHHMRPITLNDYLHNLWHKMFNMNGYNLELLDFYNLMQEKAFLKTYKSGQKYIEEGDVPQQLSILLSGRMSVYKRDDWQRKSLYNAHRTTHHERKNQDRIGEGQGYGDDKENAYCGAVYPYEFIDSYEWLMCQGVFKYEKIAPSASPTSQVTIEVTSTAGDKTEAHGYDTQGENTGECVVLTWKKEMLESIFKQYPRLRTCIHSLVGKDIADKMLRITGHSTREGGDIPDVDMVRRAHQSWRPTLRADVKNAHQTRLEREVLPIPANRAATIFEDEYTQSTSSGEHGAEIINCATVTNMTPLQQMAKYFIGAGPWCDLPDAVLLGKSWCLKDAWEEPGGNPANPNNQSFKDALRQKWESLEVGENGVDEVKCKQNSDIMKKWKLGQFEALKKGPFGHDNASYMSHRQHLLDQEKEALQRARLRVTNSRLLGMNPGALESLQPSSDVASQNIWQKGELLRYFDMNMPELKQKDLHEILKWGRWRTYYRPGTVLVRQGEEAHYVGLVLQGRLALYTEDEITRQKSLVTYVDKFDLVGSEDFSSKFRTARRTIQMPRYVEPKEDWDPTNPSEDIPQCLKKSLGEAPCTKANMSDCMMFEQMSHEDARDWTAENPYDDYDTTYMDERIAASKESGSVDQSVLVTKIPTVMFIWDIKDLKRLMLADPHVESSLSTLLRGDITFKLNSSSGMALGTRLCGVPTQARGDQDIRMCSANE